MKLDGGIMNLALTVIINHCHRDTIINTAIFG